MRTESASDGPRPLPRFHGQDMWKLVTTRARQSGDQPFLIWHPFEGLGAAWTYGEMAAAAAAVGAGMQQRGIAQGDRVLIHLENSPEFVISWLACAAVGAVAVTTNTRSAKQELQYFIDHSGVKAAITQPRFAEAVSECGEALAWVAVTDNDSGNPPEPNAGAFLDFSALRVDAGALEHTDADASAPLSIQYTSGTTSRPKGVVWSNANGLFAARTNAIHEDLRSTDCHFVYMPLFHTNALAYSMLATLWAGARMVLVPKWSTSRFWSIVQAHGCTWVSLIPLSIRGISSAPIPDDHTLRVLGAPVCDLSLDARLGVKTVGWWGMTETLSHPIVGDVHVPNRPRSMGLPAAEYEVAVVADDTGQPVDFGDAGELLVRGAPGVSLFAGYLDDPGATAAAFDERGWFHTGDRVMVHDDGHISFVDRSKDMLKVGGENVAASEIESVLLASGHVREAAVVSCRDEKLDEVPVAFVVPRSVPADPDIAPSLRQLCSEQLADFKVPRAVYTVAELPRSTINKVDKVALRVVAAPDQVSARADAEEQWVHASQADPSGDESATPLPSGAAGPHT